MNYSQALAWLYGTQTHGIKLGLENIRRLLAALGLKVAGEDAGAPIPRSQVALGNAPGLRSPASRLSRPQPPPAMRSATSHHKRVPRHSLGTRKFWDARGRVPPLKVAGTDAGAPFI